MSLEVTHQKVYRCKICRMTIEWKREGGKNIPYRLDGKKDTCYKDKK